MNIFQQILGRLILLGVEIGLVVSGQQDLKTSIAQTLRVLSGLDVEALTTAITNLQSKVNDIHDVVVTGIDRNSVIHDELDYLTQYKTQNIDTILAAIAALPAGSDLPSTDVIAGGVWSARDASVGLEDVLRGDELSMITALAEVIRWNGSVVNPANPHFRLAGNIDSPPFLNRSWNPPSPDWAAILPSDTPLSWLNREASNWDWYARGSDYRVQGSYVGGPSYDQLSYWFAMTPSEWALYVAAARATAPIWPGIAGVTLGTTVPAVASTVLELPMDGIIWLTTSYPPARARWGAAPYYSVYHTGRLAFITDNGDLEPFQYMGWQNAVYVPQTMRRAAGVVVFLEPNIEGAISPWDLLV